MIVGIAIDKWKLSIFHRHLTKHGFTYVKCPGVADTLLLQVEVDTPEVIAPVIMEAERESKRAGKGMN